MDSSDDLVMYLVISMDMLVAILMVLMGLMDDMVEFCLEKELCAQYMVEMRGKRKMTFRMGENKTKTDFVLTKK